MSKSHPVLKRRAEPFHLVSDSPICALLGRSEEQLLRRPTDCMADQGELIWVSKGETKGPIKREEKERKGRAETCLPSVCIPMRRNRAADN